MIKIFMNIQVVVFILYGVISGAAISNMLHEKYEQDANAAMVSLLLELPVQSLGEITI